MLMPFATRPAQPMYCRFTPALALPQAVQTALEKYPAVRASLEQVSAAAAGILQGQAFLQVSTGQITNIDLRSAFVSKVAIQQDPSPRGPSSSSRPRIRMPCSATWAG